MCSCSPASKRGRPLSPPRRLRLVVCRSFRRPRAACASTTRTRSCIPLPMWRHWRSTSPRCTSSRSCSSVYVSAAPGQRPRSRGARLGFVSSRSTQTSSETHDPASPPYLWRSEVHRSLRRWIGSGSLGSYRFCRRLYAKGFSLAVGGSFASFGRRTVLEPPIRIGGEGRIAIGDDVFVGASSWLQTHSDGDSASLVIGSGTSIAGNCVLSAAHSVRLGQRVLIARGVYISDHIHAYDDVGRAVLDQGITRVAPVEIGEGAWLGENVVVG